LHSREEEEDEQEVMHDLRDTSVTRSENGRSENGIGASVPDEDTSSFHYPDSSTSNREKMKSHRPWAKDRDAQHPHSSKNRSIASGASLSDTHMASRRAEQAGTEDITMTVTWNLAGLIAILRVQVENTAEVSSMRQTISK
jgi:hypothetical protein